MFIYTIKNALLRLSMLRVIWLLLMFQVSSTAAADNNLRQFASEIALFESKQVLQPRAFSYADEESGAALKKILDPARIDGVMSEYFQATLDQREVPQIQKLMEPIHRRIERAFEIDAKNYEAEHLDALTWAIEFLLRSRAASKKAISVSNTTSTLATNSTETQGLLSQQHVDELFQNLSSRLDTVNNLLAFSIRDKVSQRKFTGERAYRALELANRISPSQHKDIPRTRPLADGRTVYQSQCMACHQTGIAMSPRLGDVDAWKLRIQKGLQVMVESTLRGKGIMGAQGGGEWDDVEIARSVVYIVNASGARFEEPQPPANHPGYVLVIPKPPQKTPEAPIPFSQMDSTQRLKYGERLYATNCAACHLLTGKENGPFKAIQGSSTLQAPSTLINVMLNGQNRGRMPGWKFLQDEEIASIANFIRTKFANIDSKIEPVDVARSRR